MRNVLVITATLFFFAGLATAQVPTSGNVFFGYSYYHTSLSSIDTANTNGWEASLEGHVLPFIALVADFDAHYGSQNFPTVIDCPGVGCPLAGTTNANLSEHNYLFGPRVAVPVGKIRPFAEALFGTAHVNANAAGSDTSFATAIGGGVDYKLIRLVAWRFQGDYLRTQFFATHQNNVRLSTGIAIHF